MGVGCSEVDIVDEPTSLDMELPKPAMPKDIPQNALTVPKQEQRSKNSNRRLLEVLQSPDDDVVELPLSDADGYVQQEPPQPVTVPKAAPAATQAESKSSESEEDEVEYEYEEETGSSSDESTSD